MRDVARHAQVAQSTVSRVLSLAHAKNGGNGTVAISQDTVKRVQESIRELRYFPNLAARSLRGQKTQLIAVMIADISNPYYHQMVRKIQDIAHRHKYDVLIANTDHLRKNEEHFIEGIIRRPVDGVRDRFRREFGDGVLEVLLPLRLILAEIVEQPRHFRGESQRRIVPRDVRSK